MRWQVDELFDNCAPHNGQRHSFDGPTRLHACIRGRATWQVRRAHFSGTQRRQALPALLRFAFFACDLPAVAIGARLITYAGTFSRVACRRRDHPAQYGLQGREPPQARFPSSWRWRLAPQSRDCLILINESLLIVGDSPPSAVS